MLPKLLLALANREKNRASAQHISKNVQSSLAHFARLSVDDLVERSLGDEPRPEAPIFVLSAGWRSGSTLVQRLIMSDPQTLIWGEIYDHCGIIQHLTSSVAPIGSAWPPSTYLTQLDKNSGLAFEWTAEPIPPLARFKAIL